MGPMLSDGPGAAVVPPPWAPPAGELAGDGAVWAWQEPAVLLIEDDAADALLVEELVADSTPGMRLTWARSLGEAQAELAHGRPDCVLLDLHLPDAQGLDALERVLRAADGVAVVVLTGLAEEQTGLAAVAAGAQDYLVKGRVEPELFGRAVRYAIQRKQAEQAAAALQASQMRAQENSRLERGLLPTPLLRPDCRVQVVARYRPGRAHALLGGDFYDVVQSADGTVQALIGDVSGHGPDEAALGVALRIAWRTLVLSGAGTARQLRMLEEILSAERSGTEVFATLTVVSLSPDGETAGVTRAGHPGLLLRSGSRVERVEVPGGPALGILPPGEFAWPAHELRLPAGAGLVLFTDGLFEGRIGEGNERLGEEGLLRLARDAGTLRPDAFVDALIDGAEALAEEDGGLLDDVAVVHLTRERETTEDR
ncbi:PP2C family protein-serine/threonine phosphatase [Streptomyces sp. NPDC102490]|uniref:PP2C family protein-serine/threonine phosphatase n=1 Tax=Streptomyces sp. NPDC102490 TaxID=3366183 RepID=UPI0038021E88